MSNRCLNFTVTEKLFFKNLPGTRGPLHSGAPWSDFAHPAHPIATPLRLSLTVWVCVCFTQLFLKAAKNVLGAENRT